MSIDTIFDLGETFHLVRLGEYISEQVECPKCKGKHWFDVPSLGDKIICPTCKGETYCEGHCFYIVEANREVGSVEVSQWECHDGTTDSRESYSRGGWDTSSYPHENFKDDPYEGMHDGAGLMFKTIEEANNFCDAMNLKRGYTKEDICRLNALREKTTK